jgi:hypothetical protein
MMMMKRASTSHSLLPVRSAVTSFNPNTICCHRNYHECYEQNNSVSDSSFVEYLSAERGVKRGILRNGTSGVCMAVFLKVKFKSTFVR